MPDDNAGASTPPDDSYALLAAATAREVKLPTFCAAEAVSWFQRAEIQFRLKRENSRTRMADHVLAALPQDVFVFLSDWLAGQGDSVDYDQLKSRLLQEFVATPEQRANKLLALSRQPLGDLRASTAFREMRALTRMPRGDGTTQTLDLLRVLWLQRLPSDVRRGITKFSELSEDELIKLADSLQEADRGASSRSAMAATDAGAPQPPEEPDDEDVAAAAPSQPKRWPQTTQRRLPPRQPPRGAPPRKAAQGLCFFHSQFGHDARNCRLPCSWTKN